MNTDKYENLYNYLDQVLEDIVGFLRVQVNIDGEDYLYLTGDYYDTTRYIEKCIKNNILNNDTICPACFDRYSIDSDRHWQFTDTLNYKYINIFIYSTDITNCFIASYKIYATKADKSCNFVKIGARRTKIEELGNK